MEPVIVGTGGNTEAEKERIMCILSTVRVYSRSIQVIFLNVFIVDIR